MTVVVCVLALVIADDSPLLAHESMLRDPLITMAGVVATDRRYGHIFLFQGDSMVTLVTRSGCGRYYTLSPDRDRIGFKAVFENGLQAPAYFDLNAGMEVVLHAPVERAGQVSFADGDAVAFTIGDTLVVQRGAWTGSYDLGTYSNIAGISPDGGQVVYNDQNDQLWILDLATETRTRITPGPGQGYCLPAWSGDSRFVLYCRLDDQLFTYDRGSGTTYELTRGRHARWAPDSRTILYYYPVIDGCDVTGSDLYTVRFDGSGLTRLAIDQSVYAMDPAFCAPDRIVFCDGASSRIMTGTIQGAQVTGTTGIVRWEGAYVVPEQWFQGPVGRDSIDVPYLNQVYDTPDWFNGNWACAPSTAMMAIAYYAKLPVWSCWCSTPYGHTSDFGRYICEHYRYREIDYSLQAQDPSGTWATGGYGYMWSGTNRPYTHMAPYLENHDITSWRDDSPTFSETTGEVNAGYPYGMCVGLTTAGHLVLAIGQVLDWHTLIFNDPYGDKNTPGYPSYDGKYARYDWPGYNNGYENLNSVYWCTGARGDWEPASDTIVDDLQFAGGFYLHTASPSSMEFWHDALIGYVGHMWWTYTTASTTLDTCYAVWTPSLPVDGDYEVFVYVPGEHANATSARYHLNCAGDTVVLKTVDQSLYGDEWVSLGVYPFLAATAYVQLGDATGTSGQYIGFDAVRWNYQGPGVQECAMPGKAPAMIQGASPVSGRLLLSIQCPVSGRLTCRLYSVIGRCVKETAMHLSAPGGHRVCFDVSDCASGVYVATMTYGTVMLTRKVVIINE